MGLPLRGRLTARSQLTTALDQADPDPRQIVDLRDGIDGVFSLLGAALGGCRHGRFIPGPWRWMVVVSVYEPSDQVVVVTVQDGRSSGAAAPR